MKNEKEGESWLKERSEWRGQEAGHEWANEWKKKEGKKEGFKEGWKAVKGRPTERWEERKEMNGWKGTGEK